MTIVNNVVPRLRPTLRLASYAIAPAYTDVERSAASDPVGLAQAAAAQCIAAAGCGLSIEHLFYVASLPRNPTDASAFTLARLLGIAPGHCVDLGRTCTALLDTLHWAFLLGQEDTPTMLIAVADHFAGRIDQRSVDEHPSTAGWSDGGGAILFSRTGQIELTLLAYVTKSDNTLDELAELVARPEGYVIRFSADALVRFGQVDLEQDAIAILDCIEAAGIRAADLDGLIVTNRASPRTVALSERLGFDVTVYASRDSYGHSGGTDLIRNFALFLEDSGFKQRQSPKRIIVSSNGLGYCWSAMALEVRQASESDPARSTIACEDT